MSFGITARGQQWPATYTPAITAAVNARTVTIVGGDVQLAGIRKGDTFTIAGTWPILIDSIDSPTQFTLAYPAGTIAATADFKVLRAPGDSQLNNALTRELLDKIDTNINGLAPLDSPDFTGPVTSADNITLATGKTVILGKDGVNNEAVRASWLQDSGIADIRFYNPFRDGVTPDNAALNAAMDDSNLVLLAPGDYLITDYNTLVRYRRCSFIGPGELYSELPGFPREKLGKFIRSGHNDASGYNGFQNQGGFSLGDQNGTMLYGTAPGWGHVEPEELGNRVYWQLYTGAFSSLSTATNATNEITFTYYYDPAKVEVGDWLGFGGRAYRLKAFTSATVWQLRDSNNLDFTFTGTTNHVAHHCYTYVYGTLTVSGTTATWGSGDLFIKGNLQARLKLNGGATIDLTAPSYFVNERQITIPGGTPNGTYSFRLKVIDADFGLTSLVLQGLEGVSETNCMLTLDMLERLIIARQIAGSGVYGPIVLRTGPNNDVNGNRDHLYIGAAGQIQSGSDPHFVGFDSNARFIVRRNPNVAAAGGGTTRGDLLRLSNNWTNAYRFMDFFFLNDFQGGCLQGGTPGGGGAIRLNPLGDNVGIGPASVTPTARLDVDGGVRTRPVTVGTLPSASTEGAGTMRYCTDVRVLTAGGTLQGAGAGTGGLVTSDGTNWKVAGTNITAQA